MSDVCGMFVPVTQYGLVMKKLLGLHGGIFRYLIEHIDHAVVTGHDPFIMYRNKYVMFNIQVLGLQSVPNYFKEFLVKESDYVKAQMALPSHAGEAAIIAALHEGQSSFYQAELQKLVAAAKAKQVAYDAVCEKAALDAMSKQETVATVDKIKAEDPMKAISPISTTALAACQKARGPRPRMPRGWLRPVLTTMCTPRHLPGRQLHRQVVCEYIAHPSSLPPLFGRQW